MTLFVQNNHILNVNATTNFTDTAPVASACYSIGNMLYKTCANLSERLRGLVSKKSVPTLHKREQDFLDVVLKVIVNANEPPQSKPYGFQDEFHTMHLEVPPKALYKESKEVKTIDLWIDLKAYGPDMTKDTNSPKIRFLITFQDTTSAAYKLPKMLPLQSGVNFVMQIYKTFIEAGANVETPFLLQNTRQVEDWTKKQFITGQAGTIYNLYSKKAVADRFVEQLKSHPAYIEKAKICGVQLFSFGCGDGYDIKSVQRALKNEIGLEVESYGLDINPDYFPKENEGIHFEKQDIHNLEPWLSKTAKPQALKLAIFLGSLNSQVTPSSYEALKSLHAVSDFDLVFAGSYTPHLLAEMHEKDAGWNVSTESFNSFMNRAPESRIIADEQSLRPDIRNHYLLTPMNPDERKAYLTKKSDLPTKLDLSCSSKPLEDLSLFTTDVKIIDISWGHFSEKTLKEFLEKLDAKTTTLIVSGDEPWLSQISGFKLMMRQDHRKNELAPFAIVDAKKLSVYKQLPLRKIA